MEIEQEGLLIDEEDELESNHSEKVEETGSIQTGSLNLENMNQIHDNLKSEMESEPEVKPEVESMKISLVTPEQKKGESS